MTNELDGALVSELRDALEKHSELESLRAILVKYRKKGIGSESVYGLLDAMRAGMAEDVEDRILELMDIVSGFCPPNLRVW